MSRKDYIKIANAIREAHNALNYATLDRAETDRSVDIITKTLAVVLANENERFDYNRFVTACEIV
jgi:hypothetical protein